MHRVSLVAVGIAAGLAVVVVQARTEREWAPRITAMPSPAAAGSAQPQLSVSSRGVLLSWIERDGDLASLRFAERKGAGWTEPRTIASGRDWFVNWADVPSVLRLDDGSLYGHWLQKSAASTYAYDVRLSRSIDDGQTWSASFTPHHDGTQTEHGFATLFQMPGAGLGLVWLDGRAMKGGEHDAGAGHVPSTPLGASGAMSVRSAVFDTQGKQTSETPVDLRVCECCPTAAAVTAEGPVVAYRDRSPDEIRDIYIARFSGGAWSEPAPVHRDNWKIAACPVNGPGLSANGRNVAIAWFTAKGDDGHAFAAFSSDAGRTFGTPIRLDDVGALGRVDVALLEDGAAIATWIEFADGRAAFKLRRVTASGERSPAMAISNLAASRASGYPRMAAAKNELVFAWTESAQPSKVMTAIVKLQ
jgi:hypothetical protein